MKALYEAQVTSTGGRNGHVRSTDGLIDFDVRMPKDLGGAGGATNPEQLFAAGYASCFENALLHVARAKKIALTDTKVVAHVSLLPKDGGGFLLAVKLDVALPSVDKATGQALLDAGHQICPYSNATRGNIDVQLSLVD